MRIEPVPSCSPAHPTEPPWPSLKHCYFCQKTLTKVIPETWHIHDAFRGGLYSASIHISWGRIPFIRTGWRSYILSVGKWSCNKINELHHSTRQLFWRMPRPAFTFAHWQRILLVFVCLFELMLNSPINNISERERERERERETETERERERGRERGERDR